MTKNELSIEISDTCAVGRDTAKIIVDTITDAISKALANGDKVTLTGFGNFEAVNRAARVGRNPKTGEEANIPATTAPKFRPGKTLKDTINGIS